MEITTKELRTHAKRALDAVARGEVVTVTCRGRPSAQLDRLSDDKSADANGSGESELFGMWADRDDLDDVEGHVRGLRGGRAL